MPRLGREWEVLSLGVAKNIHFAQAVWRTFWQYLEKPEISLLYNSAIPLPDTGFSNSLQIVQGDMNSDVLCRIAWEANIGNKALRSPID